MISDDDFRYLLRLRTELRRFLHWSGQEAEAAGMTPAQHQLLLAVKGHPGPADPTVGEIAEYLVLRHHSAVGLIDRAAAAGLVERAADEANHSVVRVRLTDAGADKLEALTQAHLEEIGRLGPALRSLLEREPPGSP
jgi:DNA-binding MarR family transcriptional regulator